MHHGLPRRPRLVPEASFGSLSRHIFKLNRPYPLKEPQARIAVRAQLRNLLPSRHYCF
jgi:hypothetical protein